MDIIELLNDLTGGQLLLWKVLLTSVIFACAGLQVLLAARFYEASTVPPISTGTAARTHRFNGKLTVTLAVVVALSCLVGPAGEAWLADPGRNGLETFLTGADATGWRRDQLPGDGDLVTVHRQRRAT